VYQTYASTIGYVSPVRVVHEQPLNLFAVYEPPVEVYETNYVYEQPVQLVS
jgi:hypothetical protein